MTNHCSPLVFTSLTVSMKDKIVGAVITLQRSKMLRYSIINCRVVYWPLISLQIHQSFTQTELLGSYNNILLVYWSSTPPPTRPLPSKLPLTHFAFTNSIRTHKIPPKVDVQKNI